MFVKRNWRNYLVLAGLTLNAACPMRVAADDAGAREELEAAFNTQERTPHIEHMFARTPVMPNHAEGVKQEIQQRAASALRAEVTAAWSPAPVASELAHRLDRAKEEEIENDVANDARIVFGPETEVATIEHLNGMRREVYAGGVGEAIRANGQIAVRLDLSQQVAQLRWAAGSMTLDGAVDRADRISQVIGELSKALTESGASAAIRIAGLIVDGLTDVRAQLSSARTAAQLLRAADEMAKRSNTWHCAPDDETGPPAPKLNVHRLPEESIDGEPARVYEYQSTFQVPAEDNSSKTETIAIPTRVWVRISDGLPVRRDVLPPGGHRQRYEFEYGKPLDFAMPTCQ